MWPGDYQSIVGAIQRLIGGFSLDRYDAESTKWSGIRARSGPKESVFVPSQRAIEGLNPRVV